MGKHYYVRKHNDVIRYIVDDISKLCSSPSRANMNVIAEKLVRKCPKLQDEVDGTVVGCGYASVQNQLENRVSYVKRPVSAYRKACGEQRRLNEGTDTENHYPTVSTCDLSIKLPRGFQCPDTFQCFLEEVYVRSPNGLFCATQNGWVNICTTSWASVFLRLARVRSSS